MKGEFFNVEIVSQWFLDLMQLNLFITILHGKLHFKRKKNYQLSYSC